EVLQYDTPEQILTAPANDFVADFIGSGASLKRLNLSRVQDIDLHEWPTVGLDTSADQVAAAIQRNDKASAALVLDSVGKPRRWISAADARRASGRPLDEVGLPPDATVRPNATLSDALNELITARYSVAIVVDNQGVY